MLYMSLRSGNKAAFSNPMEGDPDDKLTPFESTMSHVRSYHGDDDASAAGADLSKVCSRYSESVLYGGRDEQIVALERASTRASVTTQVLQSSLYRATSRIETDGLDQEPAGEEFEKFDPELVTWEGPSDPEQPRNWSGRRKACVTILASLQTLMPPMASSILAPAIPKILESYHNSNLTVGSLMVSIMVLVWGFATLITAPMAEVLGRRPIMILAGVGNLVFNICCAVAPTTATMLVFRALAGLFNSAPIAISAGALADIYDEHDRQWPLAIWALAPACGPGLAPVMSGWIAQCINWRWVFWITCCMQGAILIALVLFYEETYPKVLLAKKRKRLIKETGNTNLHTIWDLAQMPFGRELKLAVVRPILFLTTNPVVLLLAIYLAFTYGFMYLILTDFPALWSDVYHYSPGIGGLMYLGYSIGMAIGVFFWTALINWWYDRQEARGKVKAEDRLFMVPVATVFLCASMLWYGWAAEAKNFWLVPLLGIALFGFSIFCIFQAVQSYIVSLNVRLAGSAVSACVWGRCMLGGTFPLFGRAMYGHLGYGWACTVVALLAIALGVPWPIGIYIYGPRLRRWADQNVKIE